MHNLWKLRACCTTSIHPSIHCTLQPLSFFSSNSIIFNKCQFFFKISCSQCWKFYKFCCYVMYMAKSLKVSEFLEILIVTTKVIKNKNSRNLVKKWKFKFKKKSDFKGFQSSDVRKEEEKIERFLDLVVHFVAKNIERWLQSCTLFLVYSQIWLNLPRDDCHFFYIFFLWRTGTLATDKKHLKKQLLPTNFLDFPIVRWAEGWQAIINSVS